MQNIQDEQSKATLLTDNDASVSDAGPDKNKKSCEKRWARWLISCILAILIIGLAFISLQNLQLVREVKRLNTVVATSDNELKTLKEKQATFQLITEQVQEGLTQQNHILQDLQQARHSAKDEWLFAKADYLISLANDYLHMGGPASLILKLLQAADNHLHQMANSNVLAIRKMLATNIAAYQAANKLDLIGLYMRLSALNQQVDELTLPLAQPAENKSPTGEESKFTGWKRLGYEFKSALQQIVIVRFNEPGALPLVSANQQRLLYQNMHMLLNQAAWGLIQQQPEIYNASLVHAISWLEQYFVLDTPRAQALLAGLKELQAINIKPDLPTLSATLQALTVYRDASSQSGEG